MSNHETPQIPDTADELVSKIDETQPIGDAIKNADVGLIDSPRRASAKLAEKFQAKQEQAQATAQADANALPDLLKEHYEDDSQTPKAA